MATKKPKLIVDYGPKTKPLKPIKQIKVTKLAPSPKLKAAPMPRSKGIGGGQAYKKPKRGA